MGPNSSIYSVFVEVPQKEEKEGLVVLGPLEKQKDCPVVLGSLKVISSNILGYLEVVTSGEDVLLVLRQVVPGPRKLSDIVQAARM